MNLSHSCLWNFEIWRIARTFFFCWVRTWNFVSKYIEILWFPDVPVFYHRFQKSCCQKWDSNPRPHQRTRNLRWIPYRGTRLNLESGALDHSAILTLVRSDRVLGEIRRTSLMRNTCSRVRAKSSCGNFGTCQTICKNSPPLLKKWSRTDKPQILVGYWWGRPLNWDIFPSQKKLAKRCKI